MPRQPAFTPEEIAAVTEVWDRFPRRDYVLFAVMQHTGLRISEALRIMVGDVTDGAVVRPRLVVARQNLKNGRGAYRRSILSRVIPLHPALRSVLTAYFAAEGLGRGDLRRPLFISRKGNRLSRRQATYRLKEVLHAAGLNQRVGYGWHGCRRSFAEGIYRSTGNDIVLTSKVLGHRSLQVTSDYLTASDAAVDAAILALPGFAAGPRKTA